MIKVIMERHCKPGKESALANLLIDLRTKAMRQPGYISGETLIRIDDPSCYLTIGTWTRSEVWKAWENSEERFELMQLITALLSEEPRSFAYTPLSEEDLGI
jgi:heme oxygenase (mycobilin-producing)